MTTRAISPYGVLSENYAALAVAIRTAGIAAGLVPDDGPELTVAQLVTICEDLARRPKVPEPWRLAVQEFVDRCERGEIRSVRTYGKFRALLAGEPRLEPVAQVITDALEPGAPTAHGKLTSRANGCTYEQLRGAGWTDETLVRHGLMEPVAYRWRFLPGGAWEMGAQRPWFTDRPGYQVQALGVIEE